MNRPKPLKRPKPCTRCEGEITGNNAAQHEHGFLLCIGCRIEGYVMCWHRGDLVLEGRGARVVIHTRRQAVQTQTADPPTPQTDHDRWDAFFSGLRKG